jgi:hypothetical protein
MQPVAVDGISTFPDFLSDPVAGICRTRKIGVGCLKSSEAVIVVARFFIALTARLPKTERVHLQSPASSTPVMPLAHLPAELRNQTGVASTVHAPAPYAYDDGRQRHHTDKATNVRVHVERCLPAKRTLA